MADARVIVTTFAGRKDRMDILVDYILVALQRGIVSEYHIWNYARSESDRTWVESLAGRAPGLRVIKPSGVPYHSYYNYYDLDEYRDAVFIKSDDDIVYVDLDRLPDFIDYRLSHPEIFLLSANVVNNGVCAFFQQEAGVIPSELMELPYPKSGFCGLLWERADLAESLHRFFLQNMGRFQYDGTVVARDRLSINFVSYLGRDLEYLRGEWEDDEQTLSVDIPARLGRRNLIFNSLCTSHLSFFSQEEGMDTDKLLISYREVCDSSLFGPSTVMVKSGHGSPAG